MADDDQRVQLLSDVLFNKAWSQILPPSGVHLLAELLGDESRVRDAIDARLRAWPEFRDGLASPVRPRTEATPEQVPQATGQINGKSSEEHAVAADTDKRIQREAAARAFVQFLPASVGSPKTMADLLDLLVAARVIVTDSQGDHSINPSAPDAPRSLFEESTAF